MLIRLSLALMLTLAACSDSGSNTPDAPNQTAATVMAVTCPASPAAMVTATDGDNAKFMPSSVTIGVNGIVQFMMPHTHNVAPNTTMSDPGLVVDYNTTKCLMFTQTGAFGFHCVPHGFSGTIMVQ